MFSDYYYVDLANSTTPLKLCYKITILRSVHCSNNTLRFLSSIEVYLLIIDFEFTLNSSPSSTEIFIEECGMYMLLMIVEIIETGLLSLCV